MYSDFIQFDKSAKHDPVALVDLFVSVKGIIERFRALESDIREALIDTGMDEIKSEQHRVVISHKAGAARVDWKAVANHFEPSHQLLTAHTTKGDPTIQVTVYAHRGAK